MHARLFLLLVLFAPAWETAMGQAGGPADASHPTPAQLQLAVEKGLFYIERQSMRWWHENHCVSCHEGPMLLVSHLAAGERGIPVDRQKLDFWSREWVFKGALAKVRKHGKPDVVGKLAVPWLILYRDKEQESSASRAEAFGALFRALAKDQNPAGDFSSDKRLDYTSWVMLSLVELKQSKLPLESQLREDIAACLQRAETWLDSQTLAPEKNEELAGWAAYAHARRLTKRAALREELLTRQRPDGSWGITRDQPPHHLVTAVALLALARSGVPNEHPAVKRSQRFLLAGQADDGRWPTKGRFFHPESEDPPVEAWASGLVVTALCATMPPLPPGAAPLFTRDPQLVAETDRLARQAHETYADFADSAKPE